jgi:hypothetical protein
MVVRALLWATGWFEIDQVINRGLEIGCTMIRYCQDLQKAQKRCSLKGGAKVAANRDMNGQWTIGLHAFKSAAKSAPPRNNWLIG